MAKCKGYTCVFSYLVGSTVDFLLFSAHFLNTIESPKINEA